jgi:hypothetical protein
MRKSDFVRKLRKLKPCCEINFFFFFSINNLKNATLNTIRLTWNWAGTRTQATLGHPRTHGLTAIAICFVVSSADGAVVGSAAAAFC